MARRRNRRPSGCAALFTAAILLAFLAYIAYTEIRAGSELGNIFKWIIAAAAFLAVLYIGIDTKWLLLRRLIAGLRYLFAKVKLWVLQRQINRIYAQMTDEEKYWYDREHAKAQKPEAPAIATDIQYRPVIQSSAQRVYTQENAPAFYDKVSKIVSIFDADVLRRAYEEFIVVDLETTGLSKFYDRIIEVAAVRYRHGQEVETFSTLVKPDVCIPYEATAVNHITDQMVAHAPPIALVMPRLLDFLGNSLLAGHNTNFDVGFIEVWARRCGYKPKWAYIDTISIAKRMIKDLPNYKQQTVLDAIGYQQQEYHRALDDCRGCAQIVMLALNSLL